jgi:MFS transporter, DHA2 family, multidrug resistance protein
VPQAVRGVSLMFCYLPANMIALGSIPQDKLKNASGLYGLTRDLGGAIALASVGTILNDRMQFHWNRLVEDVNAARPAVQHFIDAQTSRLGSLIPGDAHQAAMTLLGNLVHREALVLTYNDVLLLLGGFFVFGLMMIPLVSRPRSVMTADRH